MEGNSPGWAEPGAVVSVVAVGVLALLTFELARTRSIALFMRVLISANMPFKSLNSMICLYALTVVPTGSPMTTCRMLPGAGRLNTTIGSPLSMQSEMAVVSITRS